LNITGPVPGIPDAEIRQVEALPDHLPDGIRVGVNMQAGPGALLVVMPGVARYLVRDGKTIEVAVARDADPGAVAVYLHGSARSALIHQRGELPLHAATLVPPNGTSAIAFCGRSGIGKSTLTAELSRRGWTLMADDSTRVSWDGHQPLAWPAREYIKLWRDACERLGIAPAIRMRHQMEKYLISVRVHDGPAPLSRIVELSSDRAGIVHEIGGADRIALLSRNTFRPKQVRAMDRTAEHMRIISQIAGAVRCSRLGGARAVDPARLADAVETMAP